MKKEEVEYSLRRKILQTFLNVREFFVDFVFEAHFKTLRRNAIATLKL